MGVYLPFTPRLPSAYQEVEYIEGSGNNTTGTYINTGFKPNNNTKYVVDFLSVGQGASPIGCYNNPSGWGLIINTGSGTYNTGIHYGTQYAENVSIVCGNRVRITLDGNKVYEGDTLKYTFSAQTFQMNINAWLFCWNRNGTQSNNFGTRIRSAKIYDNGTLVRDFIPCYRKSDSVIGMYDLVNSQFYTNSGTGTFSKGNDVIMSELKNAYIGEYHEYVFDFQNNGKLNWTGVQLNTGQPFYTSGEGWTVGNSSGLTYQEEILPPNSVYDGKTLQKVKIWLYKGVGGGKNTVGAGIMKVGWTPYVCWTQTSSSNLVQVMLYDGSEHRTNTTNETGEVAIEYVCNNDGTFTLSINGGTPYNLGNYATLFRNARSDGTLGLSIGRWNVANGNIYIRKVEITTA